MRSALILELTCMQLNFLRFLCPQLHAYMQNQTRDNSKTMRSPCAYLALDAWLGNVPAACLSHPLLTWLLRCRFPLSKNPYYIANTMRLRAKGMVGLRPEERAWKRPQSLPCRRSHTSSLFPSKSRCLTRPGMELYASALRQDPLGWSSCLSAPLDFPILTHYHTYEPMNRAKYVRTVLVQTDVSASDDSEVLEPAAVSMHESTQ